MKTVMIQKLINNQHFLQEFKVHTQLDDYDVTFDIIRIR